MQMLGALQVMSKASSKGSEVGEQVEVASPHGDKTLKGKKQVNGQEDGTTLHASKRWVSVAG